MSKLSASAKKVVSSTTPQPTEVKRRESSTTKILNILDLFTIDTPRWTIEKIRGHLDLPRATAYRYFRELSRAGFVVGESDGTYVLGPRFVEFDRQIRVTDPLLQVAPPIMETIKNKVRGAQLLCTFYGDRVLTVHQERTDDKIVMVMERGRPFPLFRGAPSRIILANLSTNQLKDLYLGHSAKIASEGLGESWPAFRQTLKEIRRRGYYIGSEVDPGLVGVAAPIFRSTDSVVGCLCLVRIRETASESDLAFMAEVATTTASRISAELRELTEALLSAR